MMGQEIVMSIWILMMISGICVAKRDKRIKYLFIYNELEGSNSRFPLFMNSIALQRSRNKFLIP